MTLSVWSQLVFSGKKGSLQPKLLRQSGSVPAPNLLVSNLQKTVFSPCLNPIFSPNCPWFFLSIVQYIANNGTLGVRVTLWRFPEVPFAFVSQAFPPFPPFLWLFLCCLLTLLHFPHSSFRPADTWPHAFVPPILALCSQLSQNKDTEKWTEGWWQGPDLEHSSER